MATASPTAVISHWYNLFGGLEASPLEFYASLEEAVKRREIPNAETSRVDWHESGVFSAKREYLRVSRGRLIFDICGAPYGTGFFVSWWLVRPESTMWPVAVLLLMMGAWFVFFLFTSVAGFFVGTFLFVIGFPFLFWVFSMYMNEQKEGWDDAIVAIPIFGRLYERIFRPETYYRIDTALMFQQAVHHAVLEVIDQTTSAKGIRALTELERKPIMSEFARR